MIKGMMIRDAGMVDRVIQERKRKGIDRYDEVWEGMYVVPSTPTNVQQRLIDDLSDVFREAIEQAGRGQIYSGANVSDRRKVWDHNYRIPDLVVVLNNSWTLASKMQKR